MTKLAVSMVDPFIASGVPIDIRPPMHRAGLVCLVLLGACGASSGQLGASASPQTEPRVLRLLTEGPTTHGAFHGAIRVLSLGTSGFVAAEPAHAYFFGWDGATRGDVVLPRTAWLAGVTEDERAIFTEIVEDVPGQPTAVAVARLGDGSRIPLSGLHAPTLFGAALGPTQTSVVATSARGLVIAAADGSSHEPRVLTRLRSPSRARAAWSPAGDGLALVDGHGHDFDLVVVLPSGRISSVLLQGDLGDDPGAALAWRAGNEIVVRRGGGAFADSEIVRVLLGSGARPETLVSVPGSVTSIAAHDGDLALVSVRSRRTLHRARYVDGLAQDADASLAESTYLRPIGSLADGSATYVERDESAAAWVFRAVRAGDPVRELGRVDERAEVAAATDGDASVLVIRGRHAQPDIVDLAGGGAPLSLTAEVHALLDGTLAMACTTSRCVLRSAPPHVAGIVLDVFARSTGARIGTTCMVEGLFPEPTGLALSFDGARVAFAGTAGAVTSEAAALDAVTTVDLASCVSHVQPVPGRALQYAAFAGDDLLVSGQDATTLEWGIWRVARDGTTTACVTSEDRLNRPIVEDADTVLYGRQHVTAAIHLWSRRRERDTRDED